MTITFEPGTVQFGDVTVHTAAAFTLTIVNLGDAPLPVQGPGAPFTMDPAVAMVPPKNERGTPGSATVVLKFVPPKPGVHASSVSCGGVTCDVSGTGEVTALEELSTTKKALFIHVPDFSDGVFARKRDVDLVQEEMHSFLRLGTFDYGTEPPRAKQLLNLLHQGGPPGDPARKDGFQKEWEADPTNFLAAPPFQPRASAKDAENAGNDDVFFMDDNRIRDLDVAPTMPTANITGHGLTQAQRQEESARLYNRGGWRDHSDGNRITTTYGDKVEVIRGNYKMIVMGRQDDPDEAMGWDVSGGHATDFAPGSMAGSVYWQQWVDDYAFTDSDGNERTGAWLSMNTNQNVYEFTRFAGTQREEQWGDLLETYIGSENPPTTGSIAADDSQGTVGHEPPVELPGINYHRPKTKAGRALPAWALDNKDMVRSNPHIIEKTWARRIDSHTGSAARPVDGIYEETYATSISEKTGSGAAPIGTLTEDTWATNVSETLHVSGNVVSNSIVGTFTEALTASVITEATTVGAMSELTTAASLVEVVAAGGILDVTMAGAIAEITVAGAMAHITVAAGVVEVDVGVKAAIELGAVMELFAGAKLEIHNDATEMSLSEAKTALTSKTTALTASIKGLATKLGI